MSVEKIKEGDIIMVKGSKLLPKAIQFFMKIYAKKLGYNKSDYNNHVAIVIRDFEGVLRVAESAKDGVQAIHAPYTYIKNNDCDVYTWKEPLNSSEAFVFSKVAHEYLYEPVRYDFANFTNQIKFIITGKWTGKTGVASKVRQYCSEFAAIVMDETRLTFAGQTWDKNPFDIESCYELRLLK